MGEAEKATAEKGRLVFEEASRNLAEFMEEYHGRKIEAPAAPGSGTADAALVSDGLKVSERGALSPSLVPVMRMALVESLATALQRASRVYSDRKARP